MVAKDLEIDQLTVKRVKKYDREKITALNIYLMLRFSSDLLWLSESHISTPYLVNVLAEPPHSLKDDIYVSKLLHAAVLGRFAVNLQLSTKMWPVFGDLTLVDGGSEVF